MDLRAGLLNDAASVEKAILLTDQNYGRSQFWTTKIVVFRKVDKVYSLLLVHGRYISARKVSS